MPWVATSHTQRQDGTARAVLGRQALQWGGGGDTLM